MACKLEKTNCSKKPSTLFLSKIFSVWNNVDTKCGSVFCQFSSDERIRSTSPVLNYFLPSLSSSCMHKCDIWFVSINPKLDRPSSIWEKISTAIKTLSGYLKLNRVNNRRDSEAQNVGKNIIIFCCQAQTKTEKNNKSFLCQTLSVLTIADV